MEVARLGPARHPRRDRLGLAVGTWGATWSGCWFSRRGDAGECGALSGPPSSGCSRWWWRLIGYSVTCQSTEAFGSIGLSCLRCSHLELWCIIPLFRPCTWQLTLDFREILVLLVRNAWFDSGYLFCGSLGVFGRITHIFHVDVDSDFEAFFSVLTQNGEVCSVDASV